MKKIIFIISYLITFKLSAELLPQSKESFCNRFNTENTLQTFSNEENNLLTFKNNGGLFNGGVCWWHSKFQRNLFYLAIFKPELPIPTNAEAKTLIRKIRLGNQIVIIPGLNNVAEFSSAYKNYIQHELEAWQVYDGVVLGRWLDGLQGKTHIRPELLKTMMDKLYNYVEVKKQIAYQKLQIKGITSHAWLVVSMKTMPSGYELEVIDSNHPSATSIYSYKFGDDSFFIKGYGYFVPYLEYTREAENLMRVGKSFCQEDKELDNELLVNEI